MKSLLNGIILTLFLTQICLAQWFWQNPLPQGNALLDVCFYDSTFGITVGHYGTILKTIDRGENWFIIPSGRSEEFRSVCLISSTLGFAAGSSGIIMKTTDGGDSWIPLVSGTTNPLNGIFFSDENNGSVVGDNGLILRSSDGGNSWINQTSGTYIDLKAVCFVDNNNGFIAGGERSYPFDSYGIILKTTNGGISWLTLLEGTQPYSDTYLMDSETGWVIGSGGKIIKTTDGGYSWVDQDCGGFQDLSKIRFLDENRGYVVGTNGVYITTDSGNIWGQTSSIMEMRGVSFADSLTGTSVGLTGNIIMTSDGGNNWIRKTQGTTNSLYGISFVSDSLGMVVGGFYAYEGAIYKTTNGGRDWTALLTGVEGLSKIALIDSNTATAVGYFGTILRTTDGGVNWVYQTSGTYTNLNDVYFININRGTAVGELGTILSTTNGGTTWYSQMAGEYHLEGVHLLNSNRGYAVGQHGTILRTTNGGSTWTNQLSGTTRILRDVYFFDMNIGIIVGDFGTYLGTTDGGNTWVSRSMGSNELFLRVSFSGEGGTIVGTHGLILRTTNGGDDWILQDSHVDYHLNDVFFTSPDKGTVVGLSGTILKTINGGFVPVELTSFTGFSHGDGVILNWLTETETNNRGFEIERNFGNIGWATIGFKKGQGTTIKPQSYSFTDENLSDGKYQYRLKQINFNGSFSYSNVIDVEVAEPDIFSLSQNYPNPFNPATKIEYQIPELSKVRLTVYDILGREVKTLINEEKPAGTYRLTWNAANLPSGVYFYQLKAGNFFETKKMILLR